MKLLQRDTPVSRIVPIGRPIATHTYRYYPYFGDYSSTNWTQGGEDATNNITVTGPYSFDMVGDGSTTLENYITNVKPTGKYRINLTVTGTGSWRLYASSGSSLTATQTTVTDKSFEFTTDTKIRFVRWPSVATNLSFTINSLEEWR